ncbi:histidine phosphatase family protein [Candidatus Woesearchaeota archaeon]|nr:histidine phosphatase family protein [Candidatus Woesearchaeota archaeon]
MRLIITRHGETEENVAGIFQGHLHGKLSDVGISQAKKVALRLKTEKIDYIYSSDLARASDTTKEIAKYHPHTPVEFVEELRERYLGELQGKKESDLGFSKTTSVAGLSLKNGETLESLFNRAKAFLHKVLTKRPNDTVLFVAHNGINKALIAVITHRTPEDIQSIENLHNTGICIFDIDEDKRHKIHLFNSKQHLD